MEDFNEYLMCFRPSGPTFVLLLLLHDQIFGKKPLGRDIYVKNKYVVFASFTGFFIFAAAFAVFSPKISPILYKLLTGQTLCMSCSAAEQNFPLHFLSKL